MADPSRPNIVLLTVDSLRADHVSSYGYHRETTPVLDAFAEDGLRFSHAFSASSHTREAIPALLAGRYPDDCVDASYRFVETSIAEWLSDVGYTTGAFHSNPYISRAFGYDRGFDVFDDDLRFSNYKVITLAQRAFDKLRNRHYADAESITERAVSFVRSATEPIFLWVHYMDPHGPYCPPKPYQDAYHGDRVSRKRASRLYKRAAVTDPESITEAERREMVDLYDGEIRYTDDQIGVLFDELRTRDVLNDAQVLISSDHGDAFGENGYFGHPRHLDRELLQVPLFMRSLNRPSSVVEEPVSTLDIVPTILDSVESVKSGTVDELPGISLFEHIEGNVPDRTVYSHVRSEDGNRYRFCGRTVEGVRFIEWTRETVDDEPHLVDEWGDGPDDLVRRLHRHSRQRLLDSLPDTDHAVDTDADARIEQRLEALGYKE